MDAEMSDFILRLPFTRLVGRLTKSWFIVWPLLAQGNTITSRVLN